MIEVFGSSNAFGRDLNEVEMLLLASTVFVVSVLVALVYKLARGWEDKDGGWLGGGSLLPLHSRVTNRWVKSRKNHYGKLGTIMENEVFVIETKRMRLQVPVRHEEDREAPGVGVVAFLLSGPAWVNQVHWIHPNSSTMEAGARSNSMKPHRTPKQVETGHDNRNVSGVLTRCGSKQRKQQDEDEVKRILIHWI